MLCSIIEQTLVNFVSNDQNIFLDGKFCKFCENFLRKDTSCRVIRSYDNKRLCFICDLGSHFIEIHLVVILLTKLIAYRNCAKKTRDIHIIHPYWIRNQNLISRI